MLSIIVHDDINKVLRKNDLNTIQIPNKAGVTYEEENILIGYLYYTINYFHPHSVYLHFNFMIENPDVEILNKMFNKLIVQIPNSNYILNLEHHYPFYRDFINNNDFIEIRKTYEPEIPIDNLICHYNYINSHSISISSPFVITDKLIYKVQDVYRSTHLSNPLGEISLQAWKKVITNNLDMENSIVIYNENNDITAYLFIFHESESVKEIGWVYFKNDVAKRHLLKQFKAALFRLKKSGIKTIGLEVDNTDTFAYELFSPFSIHAEPSLITYMKHK